MRLLDGSREYTLVYEDNEGDRMLVGDVGGKTLEASLRGKVCLDDRGFKMEGGCDVGGFRGRLKTMERYLVWYG